MPQRINPHHELLATYMFVRAFPHVKVMFTDIPERGQITHPSQSTNLLLTKSVSSSLIDAQSDEKQSIKRQRTENDSQNFLFVEHAVVPYSEWPLDYLMIGYDEIVDLHIEEFDRDIGRWIYRWNEQTLLTDMVWRQTLEDAPRNRAYYRFRDSVQDGQTGRDAYLSLLYSRLNADDIEKLTACDAGNYDTVTASELATKTRIDCAQFGDCHPTTEPESEKPARDLFRWDEESDEADWSDASSDSDRWRAYTTK
jgi:hypothetical protein